MRYYTTLILAAIIAVVVTGFNAITDINRAELNCRAKVAELNYTVADTQSICTGISSEAK